MFGGARHKIVYMSTSMLPTSNLERLFYSQEEFSKLFSLSIHTVVRDTRLGRIRSIHYGRRRLIPKDEVERIAAELKARPTGVSGDAPKRA
jgi:excisionase family DNA binding protein